MALVDLSTLIKKLNSTTRKALEQATELCVANHNEQIKPNHFLAKMLEQKDSDITLIFDHYKLDQEEALQYVQEDLNKLKSVPGQKSVFSVALHELIQDAWMYASVEFRSNKIRTGFIFIAYLMKLKYLTVPSLQRLFEIIDRSKLITEFATIAEKSPEQDGSGVNAGRLEASASDASGLSKFCIDFTDLAKKGKLTEVFGRANETDQIIRVLLRSKKGNPVLVGEPGVGKTAIVESLAISIAKGEVPDALKDNRLLSLDLALLEAGASVKGEAEERITQLIKSVKESEQPTILFIDEAHRIVKKSSDGSLDVANILKPELARGDIKVIAATTWDEFKQYFEKDPALERRFAPVRVNELDFDATLTILRKIKEKFEKKYKIQIMDEALYAAIDLTNRYLWNRQQPDKSIDLLDTCVATVLASLNRQPLEIQEVQQEIDLIESEIKSLHLDSRFANSQDRDARVKELKDLEAKKKAELDKLMAQWRQESKLIVEINAEKESFGQADESEHSAIKNKVSSKYKELGLLQNNNPSISDKVDAALVAKIISSQVGLPLSYINQSQADVITHLYDNLKAHIKGQDTALQIISNQLKVAYLGLDNEHTPMGTFLLVGPSGVGKTETAHQLAEQMFGDRNNVITINMTEFSENHTVSRLIGSPPGYVGYGQGGLLTEAIRKKPYSIVLLDEVDKAAESVLDVFYQVFDKGTLTDGEGKTVNCSNTLFLMTSNKGSNCLTNVTHSEIEVGDFNAYSKKVYKELLESYKPSFLNRLHIVPYFSLDDQAIEMITRAKFDELLEKFTKKYDASFTVSDAIIKKFTGYAVESGVRNMKQRIAQEVTVDVIEYLIQNERSISSDKDYHIDYDADGAVTVLASDAKKKACN